MSDYFDKCRCSCHNSIGHSVHVMPCCYRCPRCRKNISFHSEKSHKAKCVTTRVLLAKPIKSLAKQDVEYKEDTEVFLLQQIDAGWEVEVCDEKNDSDYLIVNAEDLKVK